MTILLKKAAITKTLTIIIIACVFLVGVTAVLTGYFVFLSSAPKPAPTITLTSNVTAVNYNSVINLKANFSMPITDVVTLEWAIDSSSFIYSTTETVTNGLFTRNFSFESPGTWQFKVLWTGDAISSNATSNILSVHVTP